MPAKSAKLNHNSVEIDGESPPRLRKTPQREKLTNHFETKNNNSSIEIDSDFEDSKMQESVVKKPFGTPIRQG
uniref:Uncharacterized protein n=1 Tax=Panagrolaimus sp. JU765 TaxID=591449 RepID=A0AC34Q965_9BILA